MTFRVGQKVVCVDSSRTSHGIVAHIARWIFGRDWPVENEVYTVARTHIDLYGLGPAVELFEIRNTSLLKGAFRSTRFRPLVEGHSDISVFTAMLKTERAPAITSAERGTP